MPDDLIADFSDRYSRDRSVSDDVKMRQQLRLVSERDLSLSWHAVILQVFVALTVNPKVFVCPIFREFHDLSKLTKIMGREYSKVIGYLVHL